MPHAFQTCSFPFTGRFFFGTLIDAVAVPVVVAGPSAGVVGPPVVSFCRPGVRAVSLLAAETVAGEAIAPTVVVVADRRLGVAACVAVVPLRDGVAAISVVMAVLRLGVLVPPIAAPVLRLGVVTAPTDARAVGLDVEATAVTVAGPSETAVVAALASGVGVAPVVVVVEVRIVVAFLVALAMAARAA